MPVASVQPLSWASPREPCVAEGPAPVYRPRHPERGAFYRLFEDHFERYVLAHEERFEPRSGPLRSVVPRTVEAFLDCGRLHGGFARIRCPQCKSEHLLAFSCQTRNFCPSCQAKRAALFAERLEEEILAPVAHRHLVFTIPRALRGLFERERRLLGLLSRCAFRAVQLVWGVTKPLPV
jgi:ribosomal protein S27E